MVARTCRASQSSEGMGASLVTTPFAFNAFLGALRTSPQITRVWFWAPLMSLLRFWFAILTKPLGNLLWRSRASPPSRSHVDLGGNGRQRTGWVQASLACPGCPHLRQDVLWCLALLVQPAHGLKQPVHGLNFGAGEMHGSQAGTRHKAELRMDKGKVMRAWGLSREHMNPQEQI